MPEKKQINRKNRILLISILSIFCTAIIFSSGFLLGILYVADPACSPKRKLSKRQNEIQLRTEQYQPSCEELKNKGLPVLVRQKNDYFFVNVQNDYYHVFGINTDPSEPPVFSWWGAGLESTLEQKCK